ncbi:unnamed protein product [Effrenium voratum]|nr:unnamed protein product [Effrenium voratum]
MRALVFCRGLWLVRFDLIFVVQGWGDERRLIAEATASKGVLPALRCDDFLAAAGLERLPKRLEDAVTPSEVESDEAERREASESDEHDRDRDKERDGAEARTKRQRQGYSSGMRGWSSEESDSDHEAQERRPQKGERVMKGRGFLPEAAPPKMEESAVRCRLRGDYEPYAIDPDDTWRPHRKPYVELLHGWEFSHAWSFEPEHNPKRPLPSAGDPGGVATWRVEHAAERSFLVALGSQSQEMRRWLGSGRGPGEEPYLLEFRILEAEEQWEFRFSRCTKQADAKWRPLPWSSERHTVFWLAGFLGQDDKIYLHAGLDNFPEKRFFSARLASFPKALGFAGGPGASPFFIRDIVLFGRGALRRAPFAGRDHLVEAPLPRRRALARLKELRLRCEVVAVAEGQEDIAEKEKPPARTPWRTMFSAGILEGEQPEDGPSEATQSVCLVICTSAEQAAEAAQALSGQVVPGVQKTWPLANAGEVPGPKAAKQLLEAQAEAWHGLHPDTVRELGLFKEHLERNTRHLEGTRIARSEDDHFRQGFADEIQRPSHLHPSACGLQSGALRAPCAQPVLKLAAVRLAARWWRRSRPPFGCLLRRAEGTDLSTLANFGCDETGCTVDPEPENWEGYTPLREDPSAEFTSTEVTEMSRFLARPTDFAYLVTEVTAGGQVRSMTITRGALLRETALRPRDLRAVSVRPSGGSEVGPMLGRRSGLLLGLGGVRAVVEEERALMFGPPGRDQIRFLRVLENQKRLAAQEIGLAQAGSFRMIFVESALLALSRRLASRLLEIRQRTEPKLRAPPVLREPDLEEVRQLRRSLVRCASQASAVSSSLLSRLDGDEAKLLAAGDGDSAASHDEWEALLEAYLQAYSELSRQCTSLLMDIEDFEGSTSLALQARRLRVEQFELSLVIASVSIAAGGLVPGAMGMNLLTGWENSDSAFRVAILVTCLVVITLFFTIRFLASRQGFLL